MKKSMAIAFNMKKKAKCMADGGEVKTINSSIGSPFGEASADEMSASNKQAPKLTPEEMASNKAMVDKIMAKRKADDQSYSEGGVVANSPHDDMAENTDEYDDLVLDDDLEAHIPEDFNEHGDPEEELRRKDTVSRIMRSRALKDKLPNPR